MDLLEKLRLAQVKRYPICHTNRDQSVAEHSFGVMLIAIDLAERTSGVIMSELMDYAMMHDMEEIYTGDIPSGFKRRLRAEVPNSATLLDGRISAPDNVKGIIKLADYLEAIHYLREYSGSRFSARVLGDIRDKFIAALNEIKLPVAVIERAIQLEKTL